MQKKHISTRSAPAAIGPYSQAIKVGNIVYTSGQIPLDPKNMELVTSDIKTQTDQVMKNLETVLIAADSDMNSVIKTTCFLASMDDFVAFNEVYGRYFPECAPARSCVEVAKLPKNSLVEVEAIAISTTQD